MGLSATYTSSYTHGAAGTGTTSSVPSGAMLLGLPPNRMRGAGMMDDASHTSDTDGYENDTFCRLASLVFK